MGLRTSWAYVSAAALASTPALSRSREPVRPDAADAITLRIAHVHDETHPYHRAFERFGEVLASRTNGRLRAAVFAKGKLGVERDYMSYLRQGVLDVAVVSPNGLATLAPELSFLDLLFLWRDRAHWRTAFDGEVGARMTSLIQAGGVRDDGPGVQVLGYWGGTEVHILGRERGYTRLSHLAGAKVRVQDSPLQVEMWTALDALPVVLSFDLVPEAFRSGRIDAVLVSTPTVLTSRLYEQAPHLSQVGLAINARALLISGRAWARMGEAERTAVLAAAREATELERRLEVEQSDRAVDELTTRFGMKVHSFEERELMRERLARIQRRYARDLSLTDVLSTIAAAWPPEAPRAN